MTVTELIKVLEEMPGNTVVVMSKDGEGNSFSPLYEAEQAFYLADSTWSGERESEEDGISDDAVTAVFLWPVN